MQGIIDGFLQAMQTFGWERGLFTGLLLIMHWWVWRLYKGRIRDAKEQIARLSEENDRLRSRFMQMLDDRSRPATGELPFPDDED